MRRALLSLALVLAGCDAREAPPTAPTAPTAPPPAVVPTSAVTSAVLGEEVLDRDGDGRPDTWRTIEPDGVIVESTDTDGDGKPDRVQRFEPLEEAPPGIELQLGEDPAPPR